MRIISGTHRSRKIQTPTNLPVRPTTDMAKEALFNILVNRIDFEETRVLDLFAGTGNLSYEFASRGCPEVTSVEQNFRCTDFIKKTAEQLGLGAIRVIRAEVTGFIKHTKFNYDLIFADPPYEMDRVTDIPAYIFEKGILTPGGLLIMEHDKRVIFDDYPEFQETRAYGKVNFSFFLCPEVLPEEAV